MSDVLQEATIDGDPISIPRRFNNYEVTGVINAGSQAVIVSIRSCSMNHRNDRLAAKVMRRPAANSDNLRFLERELRLCVTLTSPYLVKCKDVIYLEDVIIIIMEHYESDDLFTMMRENRSGLRTNCKKIFRQLCLGVQYLHNRGLAHRDLKLENVLVDADFNVKICDYGFTCESSPRTVSTTICGSVQYVAPEVLQGEGYSAQKADIWAIGVLMYVALTGMSPWRSQSEAGVCKEIVNAVIDVSILSSGVKEAVMRCCDRNVQTRLSIDELLDLPYLQSEVDTLMAMTMPNILKRKRGTVVETRSTDTRVIAPVVLRGGPILRVGSGSTKVAAISPVHFRLRRTVPANSKFLRPI